MNKINVLAFGGNINSHVGTPDATLKFALQSLSTHGVFVLKVSDCFSTPAFPAGAGPDYVNAVALVESNHTALELLEILHKIEADCGRERTQRWGTRTLDIDLIAQGQSVLPDLKTYLHWRDLPLQEQTQKTPQELILPHPRMQDRAFVLVPLAQVAPEWIHPVLGLTVAEMLENLPESDRKEVASL